MVASTTVDLSRLRVAIFRIYGFTAQKKINTFTGLKTSHLSDVTKIPNHDGNRFRLACREVA